MVKASSGELYTPKSLSPACFFANVTLQFICNLLGEALHSSFYRLSEVSIGFSVPSKQSVPITIKQFFLRKIFFKVDQLRE